jgi:hypothetical protein
MFQSFVVKLTHSIRGNKKDPEKDLGTMKHFHYIFSPIRFEQTVYYIFKVKLSLFSKNISLYMQ